MYFLAGVDPLIIIPTMCVVFYGIKSAKRRAEISLKEKTEICNNFSYNIRLNSRRAKKAGPLVRRTEPRGKM